MRKTTILFGMLLLVTFVTRGQENDSAHSDEIDIVEISPSYPGGFEALANFLKENLKHPKGTSEYVGTVYVGFVVTEDGSLTDFQIMRGLCDLCDENAIEALRKMPKWIPGRVNNKAVKARMVLPVKYKN